MSRRSSRSPLCVAVAGTVGITLLQTRGESTTAPGAVTKPRTGPPAALPRLRRPRRPPRRRTSRAAAALLNSGKAQQAARDLRALPLAAGGDRRRVRALAGRRPRRAEAARRHAPGEPGRAVPSRHGVPLVRPRRRRRRAPGSALRRAIPTRRSRSRPRTCSTRSSRRACRRSSRRSRCRAHRRAPRSCGCSRARRGEPTRPRSSATASRSGSSGAASRRSGSSTPPRSSRRTTRSRRRRPPSAPSRSAAPVRAFGRLGPLTADVPARGRRPLPPRAPARSGRGSLRKRSKQFRLAIADEPRSRLCKGGAAVRCRPPATWDQVKKI